MESSLDGSLNSSTSSSVAWASSAECDEIDSIEILSKLASEDDQSKMSDKLNLKVPEKNIADGGNLAPCIFGRISSYLRNRGFDLEDTISEEIAENKSSISLEAVVNWSENVWLVMNELFERIDKQNNAVNFAATAAFKSETGQDALYAKIEELQNTIHSFEEREKGFKAKLHLAETRQVERGKFEKGLETEYKRKVRNMENINQELERRLRQKDSDFEKLRKKLLSVSEKHHVDSERDKEILQLIDRRDFSVLEESSFLTQSSKQTANRSHLTSPNNNSKATNVSKKVSAGRASPSEKYENMASALRAMNSSRRDMEVRISELEALNRDLAKQLYERDRGRGRDNQSDESFIQHKSKENRRREQHSIRSPDSLNDFDANGDDREDDEDREEAAHLVQILRVQLRQREVSLNEFKKEKQKELIVLQSKLNESRSVIENLQLELESRPSVRAFSDAQREIKDLEERVQALVLLRGSVDEVKQWRKHLSTATMVQMDKRNAELGLYLLEALPKSALVQTLQGVCRELDAPDIAEVNERLARLKTVVKAVPRMERFISSVNAFIFERNRVLDEALGGNASSNQRDDESEIETETMENAMKVLKRWWGLTRRCVDLESFHTGVCYELFRAHELVTRVDAAEIPERQLLKDWDAKGRIAWLSRDRGNILKRLRDMSDLQSEVMHGQQSLLEAERFIAGRPDIVVNRILGHIQYLFDVKALDGVLPRLNKVFVFSEEMSNFLTSLRSILGRDKEVPQAIIIDEVLRKLIASGRNSSIL